MECRYQETYITHIFFQQACSSRRKKLQKKHSCHKPVQAKVKSGTPLIVLAALLFFAVETASPHPYKSQLQKASLELLAQVLQVTLGHTGGLCQLAAAHKETSLMLTL